MVSLLESVLITDFATVIVLGDDCDDYDYENCGYGNGNEDAK